MTQDELEAKLSEAASEEAIWKSFMDHPGWEKYQAFLQEQMISRQTVVCLTPINTEYSAFAQEFFKGEFSGIRTALSTPVTQREYFRQQVTILQKDLEKYETETNVDTAFASRLDGDPFGGE